MLDAALAEVVDAAVARRLAPLERRLADLAGLLNERLPARWLTRREAAADLNIDVSTLDRRIAAGDQAIEVQRIGRAVRVRLRPPASGAEVAALAATAIAGVTAGGAP